MCIRDRLLTSCFRTKLYVGNVRKADPIVEVGKEPMNAHFVAGLVAGRNATVCFSRRP